MVFRGNNGAQILKYVITGLIERITKLENRNSKGSRF